MDTSVLSKIGEILVKKQFCTFEQIKRALDIQRMLQIKTKLGAILIELGYVKKEQLEKAVEEQSENSSTLAEKSEGLS